MIKMKTWDLVKYAINRKGMSYTNVSLLLNKSKNYITASVAMKSSPSVQTLAKILGVVGWHLEAVSDDGKQRITIE